MYKHYMPFYYLVLSRLKTTLDKISWILIFMVPPFFIGWYFSDIDIYQYIAIFILGYIAFYALHEIGYIENDIKATKKEKKPTIRIDTSHQQFLEENYYKVVLFKLSIIMISLFLLYFLVPQKENLYAFIILLLLARLAFYLHNTLRSNLNILTFFALAITKYIAILFLVIPLDELLLPVILSIFVFPVLRTMEHASREKYHSSRYKQTIGNHDAFRVKYYLFFILLWGILYITQDVNSDHTFILFVFLYFLLFRYISYFLVKNKYHNRER